MLALLGTALGFFTSVVPDIMGMWRENKDRQHELEIMDRQIDQMKLGHEQRLEEIETEADIAESKAIYSHDKALQAQGGWVTKLSASVRPVITYWFFAIFASAKTVAIVIAAVEAFVVYQAMRSVGADVVTSLAQVSEGFYAAQKAIWDQETMALFAAVMSFWFGQRTMKHFRENQIK